MRVGTAEVQVGEVEPGQARPVVVEGQAGGKEAILVKPLGDFEIATGGKRQVVNRNRTPLVSHIGKQAGISPEDPGERRVEVAGGVGKLREVYILGLKPKNHPEGQ